MQLIYTTLSLALLSAVNANPAPLTARQEAPPTDTAVGMSSAASTAAESQPTDVYTGVFTANGVYRVTSQSGYVNIAGHSLSAGGGDALVGGVRVSVASGGIVVAGGTSIRLQELTATSTTAEDGTTSSSAGLTLVSNTGPVLSTGTVATDGTATSSAGAEANVQRVGAGMVVLGGLGALLL
ncbi:hypothetical protein Slin14017_G110460 [Septoria linicola]|nr:hypothetical protein Slin14017_G110460 [Septoria linicola]